MERFNNPNGRVPALATMAGVVNFATRKSNPKR